jgi:predicted GTPase
MQQQEEDKKDSELNIIEEPQESGEKTLNVLLIGASGVGKSSLINYLAGKKLVEVGDKYISETKDNKFFEVTFENKKLRIFDTQGFNDTEGFMIGSGIVASKIRF